MSLDTQNFGVIDPFAKSDAAERDGGLVEKSIHSRNKQPNGKKGVTIVPNKKPSGNKDKVDRMTVEFQNSCVIDPFAKGDVASDEDSGASCPVHIRSQQRNGRKSLTTIQGISKRFSPKIVARGLKKELNCNGNVVEDTEYGSVIQLQGDQRFCVKAWLEKEGICTSDQIRVHGA